MSERIFRVVVAQYNLGEAHAVLDVPTDATLAQVQAVIAEALRGLSGVHTVPTAPPPPPPPPQPPAPTQPPMRTKADFDALEATYGFPVDPTDTEAYYDGELTWEDIMEGMKRRAKPTDDTP